MNELLAKPMPSKVHRWLMWVVVSVLAAVVTIVAIRQEHAEDANLLLQAMTARHTPMIIADEDGDIVFANMAAIYFFEVTILPEVWGHNITEFMTPELAASHVGYFQEALQMPLGSQFPIEAPFIVKGVVKYATINIKAGRISGNRIYQIMFELDDTP